jgi:succinyldiaminopimelate transaminase
MSGPGRVARGAKSGFEPPVYPFDKLNDLVAAAERIPGGAVDLSIGTPCDPPPPAVLEALASSGAERSYPSSVGSSELREAASAWMARRFGIDVAPQHVAGCVGTKELVAGVPHWLRLRTPDRDTVLYPELSYPTYAMGATLAGARAVAVAARPNGEMDLEAIEPADAARALCLWVNSPANPSGRLDDLGAAAEWGRRHGVPVFSDECYVEFTWASSGRTILEHGCDGLVAVHSLSKRSNLAGLRAGFFAGDRDLVSYLSRLRQHAGFMVPGPVQHAAAVALRDDDHVERQRARYLGRLETLAKMLSEAGVPAELPAGSFYLWVPVPQRLARGRPVPVGGDSETSAAWALTRKLAEHAGIIVSPGDTYGAAGTGHVRIAAVQPDERIELAAQRLVRSPL